MGGTESLFDHAPDCACHRCEPYTEWLGGDEKWPFWRFLAYVGGPVRSVGGCAKRCRPLRRKG